MRNRLIRADARDLGFIEPESIGSVFTSPPYYNVKDYGYTDQIGYGQTWQEFFRDMIRVFRELDRIIVPGGVLAIQSGTYTVMKAKSLWSIRHEINLPGIFTELIERHTNLKRERHHVWDKISCERIGGQPYPLKAYGFFEVEYVHIYRKLGQRIISPDIMEQSRLTGKEWQDLTQTIWRIHRRIELNKGANCIHPCPFPPKLASNVVKLYSYVGDLVLDPFCGIGNTCIAAARLGRDFLGIDLNEKYLFEAERRLVEMAGLKPAASLEAA